MIKLPVFLLFLILFGCSTTGTRTSTNWQKDSDKISKAYGHSLARLNPEEYSILGLSKYDSEVTHFSRNYDQDRYVHAYKWQQKFQRFLESEKHPELRSDIQILLETANLKMEEVELAKEVGVVPFIPLTQFIHYNLNFYFIPGTPFHKTAAAMARFRKYVRGDGKSLPLYDGFTSFMLFRMDHLAKNKKRGFWPSVSEVQNYLDHSDEALAGIEGFLSTWKTDEWKRDFEELKLHELEFRKFLKKKVLPYCRKDAVTPYKYYAFKLKSNGIYSSPEELIQTGESDYKKTYVRFKKLAKILAEKNNYPSSDPGMVVYYMRQNRPSNEQELTNLYQGATERLLTLLKEKNLLTVRKKPDYIFRFANKVEAQSSPSPVFLSTPLISKSKIPAQFILPRTEDTFGMDDYSFPEAILSLTAHEIVPGHALQFERIHEMGTTIARGHYAYNNANTEGWGLYSEEIVYPYLSDEEKFIFTQRLLWRQARMFLDPQINLGKIPPQRVLDVMAKELGFSDGLALSELRRYSYLMPSQAPSYYYGLKIIQDMKSRTKDEKCFNDALLNAGILPLKTISDRLGKNLNCGSH